MSDLPTELRELAESLRSCEWNHPLTAADTCEEAAKLIEVVTAVPALAVNGDDGRTDGADD